MVGGNGVLLQGRTSPGDRDFWTKPWSPATDGDTGGFAQGMSTSVSNSHFFIIMKDQSHLC